MPIATTDTIRSVTGGRLSDTVAEKVAEKLPDAELRCKQLLSTSRSRCEVSTGSEVTGGIAYRTILDAERERYNEIVALGPSNEHWQVLQRAEALMAVALALPYLNMRPTEEGGLMRAIGIVEGQRDIMHHAELGRYHAGIYAEATELLSKLFRVEESTEDVCYVL